MMSKIQDCSRCEEHMFFALPSKVSDKNYDFHQHIPMKLRFSYRLLSVGESEKYG